eukprot:scaffold57_cov254-Pinguiococcus_pyrenoidosus.AAC.13
MRLRPFALLSLCLGANAAISASITAAQGIQVQADTTPKSNVLSTLPPIALAALCTATIMYPVDLVRALKMASVTAGKSETTMQLLKSFRATHGLQGFFTQGLAPEVARAAWMRALKFFLFPVTHEMVAGVPPSQGNAASKAIASVVASIPESITIMPLEISKICLQLDKANMFKNSMFLALKDTVQRCGPSALFTGFVGVQYRQAAWTAGYFVSIDFFRRHARTALDTVGLKGKANELADLMGGFCAGVFGACFNTPGDVIRTNVQKAVLMKSGECGLPSLMSGPRNFVAFGNKVVQARGVGGLYAGFGFKVRFRNVQNFRQQLSDQKLNGRHHRRRSILEEAELSWQCWCRSSRGSSASTMSRREHPAVDGCRRLGEKGTVRRPLRLHVLLQRARRRARATFVRDQRRMNLCQDDDVEEKKSIVFLFGNARPRCWPERLDRRKV